MGLFRRKKDVAVEGKSKAFRVELGWRGLFGLIIVCFFLFFWMFLLGIWAGQTILLPPKVKQSVQVQENSPQSQIKTSPESNFVR